MNDTVMINDHRLKISTKTVKANGRNYIYYIAKMNLGTSITFNGPQLFPLYLLRLSSRAVK